MRIYYYTEESDVLEICLQVQKSLQQMYNVTVNKVRTTEKNNNCNFKDYVDKQVRRYTNSEQYVTVFFKSMTGCAIGCDKYEHFNNSDYSY